MLKPAPAPTPESLDKPKPPAETQTDASTGQAGDDRHGSATLHAVDSMPGSGAGMLRMKVVQWQESGMSWQLVSDMIPGWQLSLNLEGQGDILSDSIQGVSLSMKPVRNLGITNLDDGGQEDWAPSAGPQQQLDMQVDAVTVAGMAVSLGILAWAARGSLLLASLLVSTPAWRSLDMLPVLGGNKNGDAAPAEEEVSTRSRSAPQRRDQKVEELS